MFLKKIKARIKELEEKTEEQHNLIYDQGKSIDKNEQARVVHWKARSEQIDELERKLEKALGARLPRYIDFYYHQTGENTWVNLPITSMSYDEQKHQWKYIVLKDNVPTEVRGRK